MKKKAIWICATIAAMGIGTAAAAANAGRTEQTAAPAPALRSQTKAAKQHKHSKGGATPSAMTTRPHGASTKAPRPPKKVEKRQFNTLKLSRVDRRQA